LRSGTIQVNERSPAYYLNTSLFPNEEVVPKSADAKAPPKWKTVGKGGIFVWHDHRMHYASTATPAQVTDPHKKTKVFDYEIPIRIDGRKGAIDGTLYWVGEPNPSKLPFIIIGAAIVLGGTALVLILRRRRRRGEDGGGGPTDEDASPKEAW